MTGAVTSGNAHPAAERAIEAQREAPVTRAGGVVETVVEAAETRWRDALLADAVERHALNQRRAPRRAGAIYRRAGYALVASEPHHSFGHDLVGETWELDL